MTKNMQNTNFRKVDVDFDPEEYQEEVEPDTPSLGPDEHTVTQLLSQNRQFEALQAALKSPPIRSNNQALKDKATILVIRVLCSFKSADIDKTISQLDREEVDLLIKYIYKGFEFPSDGSSAVLLNWHAGAFQVGGLGCIVRTLADTKRL